MLVRCFWNELLRALRHWLLLPGIVFGFVSLYIGLRIFYLPYQASLPLTHPYILNAFQAWQSALFGPFPLIAPILCCLGGVDSLIGDRRDGFARSMLMRVPSRVYITAKIGAVAFVGATSIAIPMIAFFIYLGFNYPTALPPLEFFGRFDGLPPGQIGGLFGTIFYEHPFAYIGLSVSLSSLFGAVYAILGLSTSAFTNNRYVAAATPFIVFVSGIVLIGAVLQIPRWSPIVPLVSMAVQEPTWSSTLLPLGFLFLLSIWSLCFLLHRTNLRFPY